MNIVKKYSFCGIVLGLFRMHNSEYNGICRIYASVTLVFGKTVWRTDPLEAYLLCSAELDLDSPEPV
jgi:hypothetical protein